MFENSSSEHRKQRYLKEMGISMFDVAHPDKLEGYQTPGITLPEECVLLLVAEHLPQGEDATLFIKVLASMKLQPEQARHLTPAQLNQLQSHHLEWLWCAGDEGLLSSADVIPQRESLKFLRSSALNAIHGNTQNRRDLWQQICSYD